MSWSGNAYTIDEDAFRNMISQIDRYNKVFVLEECYYSGELTPLQNEFYQRKRLYEYLGKGGWHIQLDCDEYLLRFSGFVSLLKKLSSRKEEKINVCSPMIHLYKQLDNGFLVVDPITKSNIEYLPVATRGITYDQGRKNVGFNIRTDFIVIHQSWARTKQEVVDKINNWGHSHEVDGASYLDKWNALDRYNFMQFKNFHPIIPQCWPRLVHVEGKSVNHVLTNRKFSFMPRLSFRDLIFRKILRIVD
jgi:hypothetical protein